MVYNQMNKVVMHQEPRQISETYPGFGPGQYHTFYKYDAQGRVIIRGIERGLVASRASIQQSVDAQSYHWEERSTATGSFEGYTNRSIPQNYSDFDVMEVNYYDD